MHGRFACGRIVRAVCSLQDVVVGDLIHEDIGAQQTGPAVRTSDTPVDQAVCGWIGRNGTKVFAAKVAPTGGGHRKGQHPVIPIPADALVYFNLLV